MDLEGQQQGVEELAHCETRQCKFLLTPQHNTYLVVVRRTCKYDRTIARNIERPSGSYFAEEDDRDGLPKEQGSLVDEVRRFRHDKVII